MPRKKTIKEIDFNLADRAACVAEITRHRCKGRQAALAKRVRKKTATGKKPEADSSAEAWLCAVAMELGSRDFIAGIRALGGAVQDDDLLQAVARRVTNLDLEKLTVGTGTVVLTAVFRALNSRVSEEEYALERKKASWFRWYHSRAVHGEGITPKRYKRALAQILQEMLEPDAFDWENI